MPNLYVEKNSDSWEKFTHEKFNVIYVDQFQKLRPYPNSHYRGTIYGYVNHQTDHHIPLTNFRVDNLFKLGNIFLNTHGKICNVAALTYSGGFQGLKFIRPNSGNKFFGGGLYSYDELFSLYNLNDENDLLIADAVKIEKEFRCFCSDRLLTCSTYIENNEIICSPVEKYEEKILEEICEAALTIYRPAPIFVCDIAKTCEGEYKVIEYNCWNCSGLYNCDASKILTEIIVLEYVNG